MWPRVKFAAGERNSWIRVPPITPSRGAGGSPGGGSTRVHGNNVCAEPTLVLRRPSRGETDPKGRFPQVALVRPGRTRPIRGSGIGAGGVARPAEETSRESRSPRRRAPPCYRAGDAESRGWPCSSCRRHRMIFSASPFQGGEIMRLYKLAGSNGTADRLTVSTGTEAPLQPISRAVGTHREELRQEPRHKWLGQMRCRAVGTRQAATPGARPTQQLHAPV